MSRLALILGSVVLSGVGQLLLASGARRAAGLDAAAFATWRTILVNAPVLVGLAAWALSSALWIMVLAREQLSYAYVLGSLNYVLVPIAAHLWFAERISGWRLVGMAIITLGVLVTLVARAGERAVGP
jgi:drug/metabolite transporter (DMT)-like permease